jgi:DNA replication protein DnaD
LENTPRRCLKYLPGNLGLVEKITYCVIAEGVLYLTAMKYFTSVLRGVVGVVLCSFLVGCADDQTAERKAELANQNVQQMKSILTQLSDRGVVIVEESGKAKLVNYEQLNAEELENLKSQLAVLIQLGQEVLEIDARRDVRVKDADAVEQIVQLAEEALMLVSDLKNENVYLG